MAEQGRADVRCAPRGEEVSPVAPLFESRTVSGRPVTARFGETLPLPIDLVRLSLVTVVHVVGIPSSTGGFKPIVGQPFINTLFDIANGIWSQACIKLLPLSSGELVTAFRDIPVSGFLGFCLDNEWADLVRPYDITTPETTIVNLYLVEDTNGVACGSPITGHVILPTAGRAPDFLGKVFAHEIGHVLLNPLQVDDSDNPDHLMFHPENHPGIQGSRDGLFLSDCLGAHTRAREEFAAFADPGVPNDSSNPVRCHVRPRLGSNLTVIEEMQT